MFLTGGMLQASMDFQLTPGSPGSSRSCQPYCSLCVCYSGHLLPRRLYYLISSSLPCISFTMSRGKQPWAVTFIYLYSVISRLAQGAVLKYPFNWAKKRLIDYATQIQEMSKCAQMSTFQYKHAITQNNVFLLCFFFFFCRACIYPFLIRGGKPTPFASFALAFVFCCYNGFMQIRYLSHYAEYPAYWVTHPCFLIGRCPVPWLFATGMWIILLCAEVKMLYWV